METVSKLFKKIKELGHINSKRDELQELCSSKIEQILKFLPRRILDSDGGDLLDCILNGLPDDPTSSCAQAAKIIDIVLLSMRKDATSLTHVGDVISRLCLELSRQNVNNLVRWSNDSVQSIIQDNDVNMIWRDVLPECLSALASHNEVNHCGTSMAPDEYKEQCMHTLCQCKWNEKQLVQLVAMFKDMQLPRSNHQQVVNKICTYIIDVPPDVLPPLVHQLLKFCKLYHVDIVLSHLSHYFSVRLYGKLEPPPQDSESTTMDIDDIASYSSVELSRCLSTCIYHVAEGAAEPETIRKHLKAWPRTQLLRAPFLLDLALAISAKGTDFRTACLDVIRLAIEQRIMDELRIKESAWVRSVLPPDVDVVNVLKILTTESANHRELTVVGLIDLAFSLLSVSRIKPVAHACWSHGKLILVRLSKAQPETASHILGQLADKLLGDGTQRQFADCLYVLCKLTPVSVERCAELSTILQTCQPAPADYRTAAAVLDAVHPLLNFSTRTRDTLIMVCRKGLYSRDTYHRCLALSGLLTVLRNMKLSRGTFSSSQSVCSEQYNSHSYLTQLTVDLHATQQGATVSSRVRNETMCMEVVSIMRRCLVQDATVKQLLYSNLFDCAREKVALHESILELLYEHITKFLPEEDNNAPLLFEKCVQLTSTSAVLTEPIAYLLYVTSQFLQPTEEEDLEDILCSQNADTGSAYLKNKLNSIMEQICESNIGHIDMADPGLTDITPEAKAKALRVQQILQCYEALIAYRVMQWNINSRNEADSVYDLYSACHQLTEQTKAPPKSGKKNKTLKSQKEKRKGPVKLSSLTKDRAGPFKPLPCLWDLRFCLRIVELLYSEEVLWSSLEQRNKLRSRRDFHQWALRGVLSVLASDHLERRPIACYVPKIAAVIYKRCIVRFQDMCDFDDNTAVCCVEVFKACMSVLLSPNYLLKIESFLPIITGIPDATASSGLAAILEQLHTALAQVEAESDTEERDQVLKKSLAALVQTTALLLETPVVGCENMSGVIIKLEEYLRTSKQDCLSLIPAVLLAGCRDQQEAQFLDDLLTKLTHALGKIDEEDSSVPDESPHFPTIDSRSGHTVLNYVWLHLQHRFRCTEHLLHRARDLTLAQSTAVHGNVQRVEREALETYKCVVVQLCAAARWCARACALRCGLRPGAERALRAAARLYSLLAQLARRLPAHLARQLRLERLLKLCGKKFSSVTDALIMYVEGSQAPQGASQVLRDTKLIPRLVLDAELFSRDVIVLSKKANLNLQNYLSLGTARDFRIKAPVLQEALQAQEHDIVDADESRDAGDEEININDAETEIISPAGSDREEESDEEATRKKRIRKQ